MLPYQNLNTNIVAAFRGMHVSPAKHSYAWMLLLSASSKHENELYCTCSATTQPLLVNISVLMRLTICEKFLEFTVQQFLPKFAGLVKFAWSNLSTSSWWVTSLCPTFDYVHWPTSHITVDNISVINATAPRCTGTWMFIPTVWHPGHKKGFCKVPG